MKKAELTETGPLKSPPPEFLTRLYGPNLEGLEDPHPDGSMRNQSSPTSSGRKRTREEIELASTSANSLTPKRSVCPLPAVLQGCLHRHFQLPPHPNRIRNP